MPELTQEQLDALIAEKINEAKKGLFTEEDLTKKVTAEVDRRVESGIQKGLETQKKKWEEDLASKAKMTAEEIAQKQFEEKLKEVSAKEAEIKRKANLIDAKDMLSEASIPKAQYEKLIDILVSDDSDSTKSRVQNFIDVFNNTKLEIETQVKSTLSNVTSPTQGNGDKVITKSDFIKMPYGEKLKLKQTNPELYKEFMK